MTIDAIGIVPSTDNTSLSQVNSLGEQDFLNIMLTQLQFQDPLKPIDNQQFVAQLAQFSALEINREESNNVNNLLAVESNSQSIGLLGRNVEVATNSGSAVGNVTAISVAKGSPALTVTTSDGSVLTGVSPSNVTLIKPTQGN
ncbi:MAG: flagellar hook capping FlgD N-terminal domain-containing protein [Steroidobacter sp.]